MPNGGVVTGIASKAEGTEITGTITLSDNPLVSGG